MIVGVSVRLGVWLKPDLLAALGEGGRKGKGHAEAVGPHAILRSGRFLIIAITVLWMGPACAKRKAHLARILV